MSELNLDGRIFAPFHNTARGEVSSQTLFIFRQKGRQISAHYSGGSIKAGHILGVLDTGQAARLTYHCLSQSDTLKTGQATARFIDAGDGLLNIYMDWQWISGDEGRGTSKYQEIQQ